MTNRALDRFMSGRDPKDVGRGAERGFARRTGGRETPASGAAGAKGDVVVGRVMVEHKNTTRESVGVKLSWLRKVAQEARMAGMVPALALSFSTPEGRPVPDGRWVVVPEDEWRRLVGADVDQE